MKKTIFAMMIAATAFMASCGNKTTEEVEVVETPVEEAAPVIEEAPVDTTAAAADTTAVN
jgi:PBP1b-binding outer membrane lipoprotein LpoB